MDPSSLARVEELCQTVYTGSSGGELFSAAQQQLLTLQSSVEFIPQCQFILENSTQNYAQLMASTSLEQLMTTFWEEEEG